MLEPAVCTCGPGLPVCGACAAYERKPSHGTQARRRLLGQCLRCATPVHEPPHVYCAPCRRRMTTDYHARQTVQDARPGPNRIGCHGRWHHITALPWACLRCRRVYGE